jgi:Rhodopirellula transposase DDE domain
MGIGGWGLWEMPRLWILVEGQRGRRRNWVGAADEFPGVADDDMSTKNSPRKGTSKWNKIEHRLFSHITQNWRGRPLVSHEVIIQLIANTTTKTGLKIYAELDSGRYPTGIKVSDAELAALNLKRADFHGDWNYTLLPTRKRK